MHEVNFWASPALMALGDELLLHRLTVDPALDIGPAIERAVRALAESDPTLQRRQPRNTATTDFPSATTVPPNSSIDSNRTRSVTVRRQPSTSAQRPNDSLKRPCWLPLNQVGRAVGLAARHKVPRGYLPVTISRPLPRTTADVQAQPARLEYPCALPDETSGLGVGRAPTAIPRRPAAMLAVPGLQYGRSSRRPSPAACQSSANVC